MLRTAVIVAGLLAASALDARAIDQPVAGRRLILRHTISGQEKLAFTTRDPNTLFPPIGSADDPFTGTPGGVTIELFSENGGAATISVPGAVGWFVSPNKPARYKFINRIAPDGISAVRSLLMKEGKVIRLFGATTGLPLTAPLGAVGIRVTMGSLRVCAHFDAQTVRRDRDEAFIATRSSAEGLADCSNTSLGGPTCVDSLDAPTCGGTCPDGSACGTRDLSSCECIAAAQPCGNTWPVCNGECPVGEVCGSVGGFPLPGCGCIPAPATTACGDSFPTCGGDCPVGEGCYLNAISIPAGDFSWCACSATPPVDPCGGCPAGFFCSVLPLPTGPICTPNLCSGGSAYPVCGGTCALGLTCQAAAVGSGFCVCAL